MREADVRREIYNSLQGYGYWPLHLRDAILCPRCGTRVLPKVAGRPDLLVLSPKIDSKVMEVKVVDLSKSKSFAFTQIEDDQRRWLNAWVDHGGLAYLGIGTINESPRRIWVIPWVLWRAREEVLEMLGFTNMPVDLSLYKNIAKNRPESDLEQDKQFQLIRVTGKKIEGAKFSGPHWEFPEGHSIIGGTTKLWINQSQDG